MELNYMPPPHIAAADLPRIPVTYRWDNTTEEEMMFFQMNIAHRMAEMSARAALAFSLGALEWTLWRLRPELPGDDVFQFLDAAWAGLVDWSYLKSFDLPEWEPAFERPVGGPLWESFNVLQMSFVEARDSKPFMHNPVIISKIALYVCGRPDAFKTWRRSIIKRLITMYPMDLTAPTGCPVPRNLLDPGYVPSPEMNNKHIADYLAGLNWQTNRFLHSPDEMLENGFDGVPYTF
ncbi:hypothetical protein SAMN05518672_10685 [Chitinophaga sp. CF118]|uniref:hypothetical protein n=1 Tax=Chitinophaga sp. CF118 TaxID=1884367 RepID=UPI0008EE5762|nr:hypothetical protein [Chitinophaga sp. CF118]SFE42638.1 hypothetical protein SAMN05518672_10685 [Chitinophaga sp. CF118]